MTRNLIIDIPATMAAFNRLAEDRPEKTRLDNLGKFAGDEIRQLREHGYEPDAIAAAAHDANPHVSLPALTKVIREICFGEPMVGGRSVPRSNPKGNAATLATPRGPGRPPKTLLPQHGANSASNADAAEDVVPTTKLTTNSIDEPGGSAKDASAATNAGFRRTNDLFGAALPDESTSGDGDSPPLKSDN